jgi:uncharacterized protein YbjQ (UPF0145 family)
MKITTTETVAGRIVEDTLGVVRGSALWTRRIMKNAYSGLRGLNYQGADDMGDGINKAKDEAEAKLRKQAEALGADAIIGLRLEITELSNGAISAVATGTAVKTSMVAPAIPGMIAPANDDEFSVIPRFEKPALRLVSNMVH